MYSDYWRSNTVDWHLWAFPHAVYPIAKLTGEVPGPDVAQCIKQNRDLYIFLLLKPTVTVSEKDSFCLLCPWLWATGYSRWMALIILFQATLFSVATWKKRMMKSHRNCFEKNTNGSDVKDLFNSMFYKSTVPPLCQVVNACWGFYIFFFPYRKDQVKLEDLIWCFLEVPVNIL